MSKRLAALRTSGLLDTPPEESFDRIAELAAASLRAPVALVSLVEPHRQFFKAAVGLPEPLAETRETPISHSLCRHVVESGSPLALPDARTDVDFCAHPAVTDLGVGAYLGVPLRTPGGDTIGALCVIDPEPREWEEADEATLTRLGAVLTEALAARATVRQLEAERRDHAATRSMTDLYLDTLDELFFVADTAGNLVRWNRAVEGVTGRDPEELLSRPAADFFLGEDRARVAEAVAEAVRTGRGRVEGTLLTGRGVRTYEFTAVLLPCGGALCGVGRDVTERRAAERGLRESEERFRLLAETATDLILTVDESLAVRYVNGASAAVLGYSPSELVGAPLSAIVPSRFLEAHEAGVARYLATGERRLDWSGLEVSGRRKDGSEVPLSVAFGEYAVDGERYFTAVVRDVSAQREAARRLRESENRFRSFVESTSQVLFRAGPDGRFTTWGGAWTVMTGQPEHEAEGLGWSRLIHPADVGRVAGEWARHVEGQRPFETEYRVRHRDGTYHQFRVSAAPVFDADGALAEWIGTGTDVEATRRAEAGRAEALDKLRLALEAADMGKWSLDVHDQTLTWSALARRHFGVDPDAPATVDAFYELVVEEDRDRVRAAVAAVVDGQAPSMPVEYRLRRPDGAVRWFQSDGRLFAGEHGVRLIGTVLDVTEQKVREAELVRAKEAAEAAREAAEQAARVKAALLANMSHEIRTPLTGVIGYADLLAETASADDADFVEAIQRGGRRLLHTLGSVLELSQIEGGTYRLARVPVDVRDVVAEAVALHRPQADSAGLTLTLSAPAEPVVAAADARALSRVAFNLVSNAVKYTPAGSVAVDVRASDEAVEVRVTDTGVGISPGFLPLLFAEFCQESEGDARRYEGAGLGLAITKRLVEAMGGEIHVESEKGVGSTFLVRLPAAEGAAA